MRERWGRRWAAATIYSECQRYYREPPPPPLLSPPGRSRYCTWGYSLPMVSSSLGGGRVVRRVQVSVSGGCVGVVVYSSPSSLVLSERWRRLTRGCLPFTVSDVARLVAL
jgi:hypothetical protein